MTTSAEKLDAARTSMKEYLDRVEADGSWDNIPVLRRYQDDATALALLAEHVAIGNDGALVVSDVHLDAFFDKHPE